MKILLIKLKHIGDVLLTTPTVAAIKAKYPSAEISMLVRKGTHSILEGCPGIDRIFYTAPPEKTMRNGMAGFLHDIKVLRELRSAKFDYVFELGDSDRGRFFAMASGARLKICGGNGRNTPGPAWSRFFDQVVISNWKPLHQVEKDYQAVKTVLDLGDRIPGLVFDRSREVEPSGIRPPVPFIFVHPATRWNRKKWPVASWETLLQKLVETTPCHVVISSGPDAEEREMAAALASSIGPRALFTGGTLSWKEMAWLIRRSRLFIGVDTAAMHLSAACECPTIALFGPSKVSAWYPWGVAHEIIRPPGVEDAGLKELDGKILMARIEVDAVYGAAMKFLTQNA